MGIGCGPGSVRFSARPCLPMKTLSKIFYISSIKLTKSQNCFYFQQCEGRVCCPIPMCSTGSIAASICGMGNACPMGYVCEGLSYIILKKLENLGRGCCQEPLPLCPNGGRAAQRCNRGAECPPGYGCTPLGQVLEFFMFWFPFITEKLAELLICQYNSFQERVVFSQWTPSALDPMPFADARLIIPVRKVLLVQWELAVVQVNMSRKKTTFKAYNSPRTNFSGGAHS